MRAAVEADAVDRQEAARLLGAHPDTLTGWLSQGLAGAVVEFGGHGAPMRLSRLLLLRWSAARRCLSIRACPECDLAQFVLLADGEHALEHRHGRGACVDCWTPWPPGAEPCEQQTSARHPGAAEETR